MKYHICAMEYHLATKRNEVMLHVTTQTIPETISLSGRKCLQKTTYYIIPFTEMPRIDKCIEL